MYSANPHCRSRNGLNGIANNAARVVADEKMGSRTSPEPMERVNDPTNNTFIER